jgi:sugar lactone lactonase YvrE
MNRTSTAIASLDRTFRTVLLLAVAAIAVGSFSSATAQNWDYSQSSTYFRNLPTLPLLEPEGYVFSISGVAVDSKGNIYLAILGNPVKSVGAIGQVVEIEAVDGVIGPDSPTIGVQVFSPLGNTASSSSVMGLAVDPSGNVWVTNGGFGTSSGVYEVVATNGQISSSSAVNSIGSGWNSPAGIAVGPNGNVFVADSGSGVVDQLVWLEGSGIVHIKRLVAFPVGTGFIKPFGLAFDPSGNLYVSDTGQNSINKIAPVGGVYSATSPVTPVAGPLASPGFLALDRQGNVIVQTCVGCSSSHGMLEEVVAVNGSASLSSPVNVIAHDMVDVGGLATYSDGNILAAEGLGLREVQHPTANFGSAQVGKAGATMQIPYYFVSTASFIGWQASAEGATGADFKVISSGTTCSTMVTYLAGESCSVAVQFSARRPGLRAGSLDFTIALPSVGAVDAKTQLQGVGVAPQVSFPVNRKGVTVATGFSHPWGLALDGDGNMYVAGYGDNSVKEIVAVNGSIKSGAQVATIANGFDGPSAVAVDGTGNVYVANSNDTGIFEIPSPGSQSPRLQTPTTLNAPESCGNSQVIAGLALDGDGNILMPAGKYITCYSEVFEWTSATGQPDSGYGLPVHSAPNSSVNFWGEAVDAKGNLFLTDPGTGSIWEVIAINGHVTSASEMVAVGTGFNQPVGITLDAAGDVFFTDEGNGAVKEIVAVNGQVSTDSEVVVVGSGFDAPYGLAFDANGNLFVSEDRLGTIVELPLAAPPSLAFATPTVVGKTDQADGRVTATLANSGNAPLNFALPRTGMNPAIGTSFVWDDASTCEQSDANTSTAFSLASGASCTMAVKFKPTAAGTIPGKMVVADNSLNTATSQAIPLTGIGDRAAQTIVFHAVAASEHAHSAVELVAAATSHLTVSFTSKTPKVCTVVSAKASLLTAGTCMIEALQAGNGEFFAAAVVKQSFKVALDNQTINFPALPAKEFVGAVVTPKATATSALSVAFSSTTPKVCKVTGDKAEMRAAGTCTIKARQAGNAAFAAAKPVTHSFVVVAH